jgi:hypothetical protein
MFPTADGPARREVAITSPDEATDGVSVQLTISLLDTMVRARTKIGAGLRRGGHHAARYT